MMTLQLTRFASDDQGTKSVLSSDGKFISYMLELPWRNNRKQMSCIPEGKYRCVWHKSAKFGWVYHVTDVPGRSAILIHAGNLAGDTDKGYRTHSHGCLLPVGYWGNIDGQTAGLLSGPTRDKIFRLLRQQPFTLEVTSC